VGSLDRSYWLLQQGTLAMKGRPCSGTGCKLSRGSCPAHCSDHAGLHGDSSWLHLRWCCGKPRTVPCLGRLPTMTIRLHHLVHEWRLRYEVRTLHTHHQIAQHTRLA
jgi:hypothetical protein